MGGAAVGIEVGVRGGRRRRRCMGEGGWVDGCIGRDGVGMSLRPVSCGRGAFFSHRWLELGRLTVGNQQQHRVGGTAGALPEGESGEEQPEQLDGAPPGSVGRVGVLGQPEKLRDHQRRVVLEWGRVTTASDGKEEGGKGGRREKRRRRGRARGAGRVGREQGASPGGRVPWWRVRAARAESACAYRIRLTGECAPGAAEGCPPGRPVQTRGHRTAARTERCNAPAGDARQGNRGGVSRGRGRRGGGGWRVRGRGKGGVSGRQGSVERAGGAAWEEGGSFERRDGRCGRVRGLTARLTRRQPPIRPAPGPRMPRMIHRAHGHPHRLSPPAGPVSSR